MKNSNVMPSDFLDEVGKAFSRLVGQKQLSVASSSYDAEAFGNAVVILEGANFCVRIVRDRGVVSADLSGRSGPAEWHFLQRVLKALELGELPKNVPIVPDAIAGVVEQHFSVLDRSFDPAQFSTVKKRLEEIAEKDGQEVLRRVKAGIPLD